MSAIAMKWAWELQEHAHLSPATHHVLLCLADHFNNEKSLAWPTYRRLVLRTGLSERTIRRAVDDLETLKLVKRRPRIGRSGRKIGIEYLFPQLDHDWALERTEANFDVRGDFDSELAAENATDMEPAFDFSDLVRNHPPRRIPDGTNRPVTVPEGWV